MKLSDKEQLDVKILFAREKRLTKLRASLLKSPFYARLRKKKLYELADKAFTSEYLWDVSDEEEKLVQKYIKDIKEENVKDVQKSSLLIALIGCYKPLYQTEITEEALALTDKINERDYKNLMKYAILDFRTEEELRKDIQSFGHLKNENSQKVKQQYEENPYPRWRNVKLADEIKRQDIVIDILVAGCGTGLQLMNVAKEFYKSQITAFDLSSASIAYALRNTREHGIDNVEFFCGDLLQVKELNRTFDYIISTGVLHHCEDPYEAWKQLASVLKPGGGMTISIYSETARQPVKLAQSIIAEKGWNYSQDNLKKFRNHLKGLPKDDPVLRLALWGDFYSVSECRDMVFHIKEHNFTIPKIKDHLQKLGLIFNGFMPKDKRLDNFFKRYPTLEDQLNLDLWHEYEQENPTAFTGMYQFACLKPVHTE